MRTQKALALGGTFLFLALFSALWVLPLYAQDAPPVPGQILIENCNPEEPCNTGQNQPTGGTGTTNTAPSSGTTNTTSGGTTNTNPTPGGFSIPSLPTSAGSGSNNPTSAGSGSNNPVTGQFRNPLNGVDNLPTLLGRILQIVVRLGAYVAVLFIIWSGFLFVKAQGNTEALSEAKTTFFYTMIGVGILLGAEAIAYALTSTINSVIGT
ncbi:pilin [Candidatus Parcubacteria bacterium]|nr:pilin [Candidatus Parcubacteria bacterium]